MATLRGHSALNGDDILHKTLAMKAKGPERGGEENRTPARQKSGYYPSRGVTVAVHFTVLCLTSRN